MLHQIPTSAETLTALAFETNNDLVPITLTHNDPRFTLVGIALNKKTGNAEGEVRVTALNQTRNTEKTTTTRADDGAFEMQLEPASDFSISGKKASYISNIETVSTMALNRSTTLFVELQLTIEQVQAGQSIVLNNIYYATGSAKLNAAASSDLKKVTRFLLDNPTLRIQISSHSDSRGSAAVNLSLSNARATAVTNYLRAQGIPPAQMVAKGYGETQLLNNCADGKPCSEAQHQQNRRTTFNLIQ
jgi:outer membrane protein OmpA-like peptidoglycan-associated protein